MQKLTPGRIVHVNLEHSRGAPIYKYSDITWVPAICTRREKGKAELFIFPSQEWAAEVVTVDVRDVDDGHGANEDAWRWPPRE